MTQEGKITNQPNQVLRKQDNLSFLRAGMKNATQTWTNQLEKFIDKRFKLLIIKFWKDSKMEFINFGTTYNGKLSAIVECKKKKDVSSLPKLPSKSWQSLQISPGHQGKLTVQHELTPTPTHPQLQVILVIPGRVIHIPELREFSKMTTDN